MTAVTRAKVLIEALLDKTVPEVLALRVVDRYLVTLGVEDVDSLTDEEKASAFLNALKTDIKNYTVSAAVATVQRSNQAQERTASDSAESDFS